MKRTRVTTELIKSFRPCKDRLDNFKQHYGDHTNYTPLQFTKLINITHRDKVWVLLRLLTRTSIEVFAIESAISAYQYADAAYAVAAYAADAAADADAAAAYAAAAAASAAADAAAYAAAVRSKEEENQLKSLLYLLKTDSEDS